MLRFIILMLLSFCVYAKDSSADEKLLLQVQEFAKDLNNNVPTHPVLKETEQIVNQRQDGAQLIVFISTSMAKTSIIQWATQADLLGAGLVVRGFINNSFKDTVKFAQELFAEHKVGGFNVDPLKFKSYAIQVVPAVVLDVNGRVDIVYGDIGLIEALKIIQLKGESALDAQKYISKI